MKTRLEARLQKLGDQPGFKLGDGLKGLEKESLRVNTEGYIAKTPHPAALGSALTHPNITTDYSEALLELITPPLPTAAGTLEFLAQLHSFVYSKLDNERLWCTSMPCRIGDDDSIPVAWYGTSNVGRMKHVYRLGLGHRYGRVMQTIAGVHFNYSLPEAFWPALRDTLGDSTSERDFRSAAYFGLIRNFQRFGWLIPFLFGSSPAICRSFMPQGAADFDTLENGTLYRPFATSLRMSDIGYKNKNQAGLRISYKGVDDYVRDLGKAIETPLKDYEQIGTFRDEEWRQLNTNILQIENEYYSFIRPKQIARSGEKPTMALKDRGVQYIEVRAFDVNPFEPIGVNTEQMKFAEAFVLMCMLAPSPAMGDDELTEMAFNQQEVATNGRAPGLALVHNGSERKLQAWVDELLDAMVPICELLDGTDGQSGYVDALARQRDNAAHPDQLPSAQVLEQMRANHESFFEFSMRRSDELHQAFKSQPTPVGLLEALNDSARASIDAQKAIEEADTISFPQYLEQYFAQSATNLETSA